MCFKLQKQFLIFVLFLIITASDTVAQCFSSPGNPIGGTANMGTVDKNMFRVASFYKYNYADQYYHGAKKSDYVLFEKAYFNYSGLIVGYGVTDKFTIETEAGYFINKTLKYHYGGSTAKGHGFSNAMLTGKYNLYMNNEKLLEWTAALGAKAPLRTKAQVSNYCELPVDAQPSSGSFGIVLQSYLIKAYSMRGYRYFLLNRFEYNFPNSHDFYINKQEIKYGNSYYTSIFMSKHLWFPWTKGDGAWTAILQVRNEIKARRRENNEIVKASGSNLVVISPQMNLTVRKRWNLSFIAEIPAFQYYNETQLGTSYSFLVNITRDFGKDIYFQ
ncbi:MAG: hypothetical protein HY738_17045 [Bacteroidia bacterium]|nr:hypothetical protein [Bacteroidia bacterium]